MAKAQSLIFIFNCLLGIPIGAAFVRSILPANSSLPPLTAPSSGTKSTSGEKHGRYRVTFTRASSRHTFWFKKEVTWNKGRTCHFSQARPRLWSDIMSKTIASMKYLCAHYRQRLCFITKTLRCLHKKAGEV